MRHSFISFFVARFRSVGEAALQAGNSESVIRKHYLDLKTAAEAAEFFNILNHPNFNAPNFGGNGVVSVGGSGNYTDSTFGAIGSTRDAPFDPRQIQFALKLYY